MRPKSARRLTRGLRFRLTAGYALFFALVLIGVAALFRSRLESSLDEQMREVLLQEWAAMKGYLQIRDRQPRWFFDRDDPDESFIVERLRRVYMLADAKGNPIQWSTVYHDDLTLDSPEHIRAAIAAAEPSWRIRTDRHGEPYLIRAGVVYDEAHRRPYYVAIGRSLAPSRAIMREYTWIYAGVIPLGILCGCVLGWFLAGNALKPVKEVARAAQRISGSNLGLRIPVRGAGDELDYLIETFNRMIERLEKSFQQIRQFSTDVSHELRTPITAIRGQLEVAMFTARTTEQYRDGIFNALEDVERLSQIVRALLLLSQAESGQLALQKVPLDLAAVLRDLVEQFEIPADGAGVRISADLPEECVVEADRVQIERMVSNLLSNALKFTPQGGTVRVALERLPDSVEIAVEDTGRGIPTEHLPHIFDRFYRVPETHPQPGPEKGLGLGLSFVAWIARAHGGRVEVASEPGRGSRFVVVLPALATPTDQNRQPAGHPAPG
ncbi:MAG TPA: heavy metal sensor histidine kinase [Bryobacteraceae bacterium]|nr:heavy metal sensor histidine kinase [Bryobacteraceae bacterium]